MSLTLRNAVVVLDHQDGRPPVSGYTRARHHIGHIDPGDYWLPRLDQSPHTVTMMHRKGARTILIDQFGIAYSYSADAILTTAVPDPRTHALCKDQGRRSAP